MYKLVCKHIKSLLWFKVLHKPVVEAWNLNYLPIFNGKDFNLSVKYGEQKVLSSSWCSSWFQKQKL